MQNPVDCENDSTANGNVSTEMPERCSDLNEKQFVLRGLWMYGGYPIVALGTVGHILSVTLLLGSRGMRSLSLSVFLLTMSLSGLIVLYVGLLTIVVEHHTCHHVLFKTQTTETGCRLHVATIYFTLQLYSWMEACVALERLSAVRWPHKYRVWFTRRNNIIIVCVIVGVLMGLNTIPFVSYGFDENGFCAAINTVLFDGKWRYLHCIVYVAIPVSVMLPCNAVTLHTMCRPQFKESANVKKAKPITIMMLSLNAIFVVTAIPIMAGDWNKLDANDYFIVEVMWCICRLLMYLGSSLTFVVYLAVAARFRKALKELLLSGKAGLERAVSALTGGADQFHGPPAATASAYSDSTNAISEDKV